jgi:hypothetical protein
MGPGSRTEGDHHDHIAVTNIHRGDMVESGNGTQITVSDVLHQDNGLSVLMYHDGNCERWATVATDGVLRLVGAVDPDTLPPLPVEFETDFGSCSVSWDMDGMSDVIDFVPPGPMPGLVYRYGRSGSGFHCGQVWAGEADGEWHGRYQRWLTDESWPVVSGSLRDVVLMIACVEEGS